MGYSTPPAVAMGNKAINQGVCPAERQTPAGKSEAGSSQFKLVLSFSWVSIKDS